MIGILAQFEGAWEKAAEFGVIAFLLVITLMGVGFALWKLGNRLVDAGVNMMERQTVIGDKQANALEKISDLTAAIQLQNEQVAEELASLVADTSSLRRAHVHIIDAVEKLDPERKMRVQEYLDKARRELQNR